MIFEGRKAIRFIALKQAKQQKPFSMFRTFEVYKEMQ